MLTASAGVIDDLIVYFLSEDYFRLVVNSATREKDLAWISEQAEPYGLEITVRGLTPASSRPRQKSAACSFGIAIS